MTTLAVSLDELAQANSDGLLNDDEYRVLRQDLFERYAPNTPILPDASPIPSLSGVPNVNAPYLHLHPHLLGRIDVTLQGTRPSEPSTSKPKPTPPTISHSTKFSTPPKSSMNLFLRRTSSKKDEPVTLSPPPHKDKKPFIPKLSFTRKLSDMALNLAHHSEGSSSRQKEPKRDTSASRSKPTMKPYHSSSPDNIIPPVPPISPSRSSGSSASVQSRAGPVTPTSAIFSTPLTPKSAVSSFSRPSVSLSPNKPKRSRSGSSSTLEVSRPPLPPSFAPTRTPSSSSEIFDDTNLVSVESIRNVIGSTKVEMSKLIDMFEKMEERVVEKVEQRCQSLGIPTPTSSLSPTNSSSLRQRAKSPSFSLTSARGVSPSHSGGLRRKASLSSLASSIGANSSFANLPSSFGGGSTTLVPPVVHRSRSGSLADVAEDGNTCSRASPGSADHPPKVHKKQPSSIRSIRSVDTLNTSLKFRPSPSPSPFQNLGPPDECDDSSSGEDETIRGLQRELTDVRRKKDEVVWRYEARLEYLRVRLKGAELAEKVAKR